MIDVKMCVDVKTRFGNLHVSESVLWYLDVIKRMMTFTPTTTTDGCKLDDGVKWDLNRHALFDTGIPKVCHQTLQYTDMTYNQRRYDFLLDINNNAGEA